MTKRKLATFAALALAVGGLTACSPGETNGGEGENLQLTVYYGTPRDIMKPLFDGFKADHPNVTVEEFRQPTEELMSTLQLELQANHARADVVISSAAQLTALNDSHDAFQAYETSGLSGVTESLRDPENTIHPLGVNLYMIAYNKDVVSEAEAPKSFAELLDPKWDGKIALADPNNSASIHTFIWFMTQHLSGSPYGWEFFQQLGELNPRLEASHGTIRDLVLSGERPIGLLLTEHVPHLLAEGEPGAWVMPEEGLVAEPLGIGIVNGTANDEASKLFLDWVHSAAGQKLISETIGLVPVRGDVPFEFVDGTALDQSTLIGVDSLFVSKNRQNQADQFHQNMGTR